MKVKDLAKAYIEGYAKPYKKSWKRKDDYFLRSFILPVFGERDCDSIMRGEVEVFHKSFNSIYTGNQVLAVMCCMFNRGIDWEMCKKNPASRVRKFREKPREKYIPRSKKKDFLEALDSLGDASLSAMVRFILLCGCRKKEALNLKWEDIDFEGGVITLRNTKNKTDHRLPITQPILRLLKATPRKGDYVFYGDYRKDVKRQYAKLKKAYGDPTLRLGNDLRRTVGSHLAQENVGLDIIGQILNHKDSRSTRVYAKYQLENLEQGLNLLH